MNLCFYLLDKGYLRAAQIVDGEYRVDAADSRNKNFIVNKESDNSYFIKQVSAFDLERTGTLRTEATCYWLANKDAAYQALKDFVPVYHGFDYTNHILVLGYEKGNINLQEFIYKKSTLFLSVAELLGKILSGYHHQVSQHLAKSDSNKFFKRNKPWVFSLGNTERYMRQAAGQKAESQVIRLIHDNQKFKELIGVFEDQWGYQSLIHNDIKFTNFIINADYDESNTPKLKLIDWELADIGDPLWDVAAVLQAYLLIWVTEELNKTGTLAFSLEQVQQSMQRFWNSYAAGMSYSEQESGAHLLKAINFCALKLIHTCFETTPGNSSLPPYGAKLLQLSFNILNAPLLAQQKLFGIYSTQPYETAKY